MKSLGMVILVMMLMMLMNCATAEVRPTAAEVLVRPFGLTQMGDEVFEVQEPIMVLIGGEKQIIEQGERLILDRRGNIAIARKNKLFSVFSLDGSSLRLIKVQEPKVYSNYPYQGYPSYTASTTASTADVITAVIVGNVLSNVVLGQRHRNRYNRYTNYYGGIYPRFRPYHRPRR